MNLTPVTDPALLQQLGTQSSSAVTDPELLNQLNGTQTPEAEDPGVLKSAAAGLMSGVPLAETAVAGASSLIHDTPYAKEHAALEALKDAAWDKHPYAYGAGKTGGMVGTGLATGGTGIPGAIGIGAAAGVDETADSNDLLGNIIKGGAVGGAMGTIGEKVISPLIHSALPALGKGAVGSLVKGGSETVDNYLANPEAINNAKGSVAQGEVLQQLSNELRTEIDHLSTKALSKLNPDSYTNMEELQPVFDSVKQGLMTDGVVSPTNQAAFSAVEQWENMLKEVADKESGNVAPSGRGFSIMKGSPEAEEMAANPASQEILRSQAADVSPAPSQGSQEILPGRTSAATQSSMIMGQPETTPAMQQNVVVQHGGSGNTGIVPTQPEVPTPYTRPQPGAVVVQRGGSGNTGIVPPQPEVPQPYDLGRSGDTVIAPGGSGRNVMGVSAAPVGKISEPVIGSVVRDLNKMIDDSSNTMSDTANAALKDLRATLHNSLKGVNADYADAMKNVQEPAALLDKIRKAFSLQYKTNEGLVSTDTTNSKLSTVLNENKSHAQEALGKLDDRFGTDFIDNARNYKTQQAFDSGKEGGMGMRVLGHGSGLIAGLASGIPHGGLIGSLGGGIIANQIDGGAVAKSILNTWMKGSQALEDSGLKAAYAKYGPILANAAKMGGTQLAATHFVLATSHPEYQALVQHAQENQ